MKRLWIKPWSVLLLVLLAGLCCGRAQSAAVSLPVDRARVFLKELFDSKFDLLPEFMGSKTYWLYHDNYLAAKILESTEPQLAARIRAAMAKHGVTESGKIEILFGEAKRPLPFRHFALETVAEVEGRLIRTERVTSRPLEGWEAYADLLFFASMAEFPVDPKAAERWLDRGLAMWDGKGFRDRVVGKNRLYATYKLALAILASDRCHKKLAIKNDILNRLASLQSNAGGWITDYDADGKPRGLANVETTCLVILAAQTSSP